MPQIVKTQRYSVPEAFEILRISRALLYKRITDGSIAVSKDGKRTFILGSELIRYMQADAAVGSEYGYVKGDRRNDRVRSAMARARLASAPTDARLFLLGCALQGLLARAEDATTYDPQECAMRAVAHADAVLLKHLG